MMKALFVGTMLTLVVAIAPQVNAQATVSTGVQNFPAGGNFLDAWYFDVNFGSTPVSVDIAVSVTASSADGAVVILQDITSGSKAVDNTAWVASRQGIQIGQGTVTNYPFYGAGAQSPFTPVTVNLSGVCRFHFTVQPATNPPAASDDITVGMSTNVGSLVGTITYDAWSTQPAGGGTATVGTSTVYQRNYSNQVFIIEEHNSASDVVELGVDIDFPTGTPEQTDISVRGITDTGVVGQLQVELHDMTAGGGATAQASITISNGAPACATFQTAAYSGLKKFRIVIRAGTGYGSTPAYLMNAWVTFGSNVDVLTAITTPVQSNPVVITPASTSFTTSPATLTASGGTPTVSYVWSIQGTVPTGVSLSTTTGATTDLIFGGTTPAGSTVTVRCANGTTGEFDEETYTLNFGGGGGGNSLTIITTSLPNGSETVVYTTTTITATSTGTTGPTYTWSVSAGTIPPGLVLDTAATGLSTTISGTPTTAGTYNFTVQITDGTNSDTQDYTVDISAAGALVITTSSLPAGTQGTAYSANITAINGTGTHTWSISAGTLPTGLSLGASTTGTVSISGTPTQTGTFPITVMVVDGSAASDTQAFSLVINAGSPPPSLSGGGGGGGGGGCAATDGSSYWMFALGLLAMLGFGLRMRARRE